MTWFNRTGKEQNQKAGKSREKKPEEANFLRTPLRRLRSHELVISPLTDVVVVEKSREGSSSNNIKQISKSCENHMNVYK